MGELPTGTVTFLFTDIEASTERWERQPGAMDIALRRHDTILRQAIESNGGHVFKTVGDAFCAAFADASGAVTAAVAAQRALHAEPWSAIAPDFAPLTIRIALHTGLVEVREGDYFGPPVNRVARLMSAGHGGQILVSLATHELVRDRLPDGYRLRDLGTHRLRDLRFAEHVFQIVVDDLPDVTDPPRTAEVLPSHDRAQLDDDLLPAECPYRGLRAFREADASFFFGRETFTERLTHAVSGTPLVSVIGPSGSGKSSVVFAGLVPQLRGAPDTSWSVVDLRPGSRPIHALADALLPALGEQLSETDRLIEVNKLADALTSKQVTITDIVGRMGDRNPALDRLLIVADQFEELFTLGPNDDARHRFQDLLFDAVSNGNGQHGLPISVALTLRADFMGHALAYRPFTDAIQDRSVVLGPMTREELALAIAKPAEKQGREFESGLVERIIDDVGQEPGRLPLLEFALTRLWDHQQGGWLTHGGYERIGRVEGAVARHADAVYERLSEGERRGAHRVFVQMVRPGEGTEDTRRLALREELGDDWPLIGHLADARLVVTNLDSAGRETVEVVHEALIRSWDRLRGWMKTDRRFRTWQERLRFAIRQWEDTDRDDGALLRGVSLAEAEGWLSERRGSLTPAERNYIEASTGLRQVEVAEQEAQRERELEAARRLAEAEHKRADAERDRAEEQARSARRLRRGAVVLAGAGLLAAVLAVVAIALRDQAQQERLRAEGSARAATGRELALAAAANLDADPERSVLLALHAVSATRSIDGSVLPEAASVLHRAVQLSRSYDTLSDHRSWVNDAAYSPDGSMLATGSEDGTIRFWDTETLSLLDTVAAAPADIVDDAYGSLRAPSTSQVLRRTLGGHVGAVLGIDFSPDGRRLASSGADRTVNIWDVDSGRETATLIGHDSEVWDVAFSPGGDRVASSSEGPVIIWDPETSEPLQELIGHTGDVLAVVFDPEGKRIATGGEDQTARVWDARTGQQLLELTGHTDSVTDVAFNPDGTRLLTTSGKQGQDTTARVWDVATGALLQVLAGHSDGVLDGAYSPDGDRIATGGYESQVRLYDARSGREVGRLAGQESDLYDLEYDPDGTKLLAAGRDRVVRLWDLVAGRELTTYHSGAGAATRIALSPDGGRVVSTGGDASVAVRDAATGQPLARHVRDSGSVQAVAFTPDGAQVAMADDAGTLTWWDADRDGATRSLSDPSGWISRIAFDAEGTRLATAGPSGVATIWDSETGTASLTATHGAAINGLHLTPDGTHLVTGGADQVVRIWNAETGAPSRSLTGHEDVVTDVAFDPSGSHLVSASADRTARVWDVDSGRLEHTLAGHTGQVARAAFSPDGRQVVTVGLDGNAILWNLASGLPEVTLASQSTGFVDVAFGPDGVAVWVADLNGEINALAVPTDALVGIARERVTRPLTTEECRTYLHVDACPPSP